MRSDVERLIHTNREKGFRFSTLLVADGQGEP